MRAVVLCSLNFIKADESIYDFNFKQFSFVKGEDKLPAEFFNRTLINLAGVLNIREFLNYPYVIRLFDVDSMRTAIKITPTCQSNINQLINCLWFSKDCSVNVNNLYTSVPDEDKVVGTRKAQLFSNSAGKMEEMEITLQDFQVAATILEKISSFSQGVTVQLPDVEFGERAVATDGAFHYRNYNDNNRLEKAYSFLTMARSQSFLPLKIALLMSLLESLFMTGRSEVTHKVCERSAFYIGSTFEERSRIYTLVSTAYDVRSGFFHGQSITKKKDRRENLETISTQIDTIVRTILKKAILDDSAIFLQDEELLNNYFHKLIFDK